MSAVDRHEHRLGHRWAGAKVLLEVEPDVAAGFVSPLTGRLEATEHGTMLGIGADDLDWIARFLAGLPCDFSVVQPDELREASRVPTRRIVADGPDA